MRRVAIVVGLAQLLLGCSVVTPQPARGEQVPLMTSTRPEPMCVGSYMVMDIVADPIVGTVAKQGGWPLKWPHGYTGWRFGSEVQVLDPTGEVVLTTGQRYELALRGDADLSTPMQDLDWTEGCIPMPCSRGRTCELGGPYLVHALRSWTVEPRVDRRAGLET